MTTPRHGRGHGPKVAAVATRGTNEGVVEFLDKNNKDDFDDIFLLSHPLLYLLEGTLGGKCIVYHGYTNKIGWSKTYVHFSCYH